MSEARYDVSYKGRSLSYWLTPSSPDQVEALPRIGDGDQAYAGGQPPGATHPTAQGPRSSRNRRTRRIVTGLIALIAVTLGGIASLWHRSQPALARVEIRDFPKAHTLAGNGLVGHLAPAREYQGRLPGSQSTPQPVVFQLGVGEIRPRPLDANGTFPVNTNDHRGVNYFVAILPAAATSGSAAPEFWFGSPAQQKRLLQALQSVADEDDDQSTKAESVLRESIQALGKPFQALTLLRVECASR